MTRTAWRPTVAAVAALLLALPLSAQSRAASEAGGASWTGSMVTGSLLRWSRAGSRQEGVLVGVDGRTLTVRSGTDTLRLDVASGDSIWVRGSSRAIGGLVGFLVGAAPVALSCGSGFAECGLVPTGVVLMAAGTGIGVVVGGKIPQWRRRGP